MALNDRIRELRKANGMTQEALGKAVGVSAQAVSKWENDGAPDVELLPVLADTLGVTIDGLFGRSDQSAPDMEKLLFGYISNLPMEKRMERLCKLIWVGMQGIIPKHMYGGAENYLDTCRTDGPDEFWIRSQIQDEFGLILGCPSRELHFFCIFPEPEKGYAAYLEPTEKMAELFACLGRPRRLETLCWLSTQEKGYGRMFTAETLAAKRKMTVEMAEECLDDLRQFNLVSDLQLVQETGETSIYSAGMNAALIPLLFMGKWLCDQKDSWAISMYHRDEGLLKQIPGEEEV